MNQYHFAEHSCSDNTVTATMVMPVLVESYCFEKKTYPDVHIRNRGLAYHLAFTPEDTDEKKELRNAVEEYNEYLEKLETIPGFLDYFVNHGLCVSREEVAKQWSEEIADIVFSKKSYCFTTELTIMKGYLFDYQYSVKYKVTIDGTDVLLPIGENAEAYPTSINGKNAIWNWVDNGHDICFDLWRLLGERTEQYDEIEETESDEDDAVSYWSFDIYDQIRYDDPEPQLVKIFKKLESLGYIQTYTIKSEKEDPNTLQALLVLALPSRFFLLQSVFGCVPYGHSVVLPQSIQMVQQNLAGLHRKL